MLPHHARALLRTYLEEDIRNGDVTTRSLPQIAGSQAVAVILAQSKCVLAGVQEALEISSLVGAEAEALAKEGEWVTPEQPVVRIRGDAAVLLSIERVILNIMMRMSGIATKTRRIVERAKKVYATIRVAATRKTTPGFRFFEKRAVEVGGGDPHRYALDDMVLIKNNHISIVGGARQAVQLAKKHASFSKKISCEVRNDEEAIEAIQEGADIILLDNFSPDRIVRLLERLQGLNIRQSVVIEASGGIDENNVEAYAQTGVDVISCGALTHSYVSSDFNMRIENE